MQLVHALSEKQGVTRNAKKIAVEAKKEELRKRLRAIGCPNIAKKIGVDIYSKLDAPLIEMGHQNNVMQQEFGRVSKKRAGTKATDTESGELRTFSISLNNSIFV